jgi:hypothetical protein
MESYRFLLSFGDFLFLHRFLSLLLLLLLLLSRQTKFWGLLVFAPFLIIIIIIIILPPLLLRMKIRNGAKTISHQTWLGDLIITRIAIAKQ